MVIVEIIGKILEFIVALGILMFLHELGHYLFCKVFKIEVEEFGFGFPPRLVKLFTWDRTDFTINAIPFGAFVRPRGENDPKIPGGMSSANPWKRLGVLIGGPLMNIITGMLLFSLVFSINGVRQPEKVLIIETAPGSPAETVGLLPNDLILSVDGETVLNITHLSSLISKRVGQEVTLGISRGGETLTFTTTPRVKPPENQGALGITMTNPVLDVAWPQTIPYAVEETINQGASLFSLPYMLITGQIKGDQARLISPVGIFAIYKNASEIDKAAQSTNPQAAPTTRLELLAFLSVAIGFTNLFPLPALDGGRILFLIPEILFRRRVPAEKEAYVHAFGFFALIILMIFITGQDIIDLFSK